MSEMSKIVLSLHRSIAYCFKATNAPALEKETFDTFGRINYMYFIQKLTKMQDLMHYFKLNFFCFLT